MGLEDIFERITKQFRTPHISTPPAWEGRTTSPWMKMFQNAREFCVPSEE